MGCEAIGTEGSSWKKVVHNRARTHNKKKAFAHASATLTTIVSAANSVRSCVLFSDTNKNIRAPCNERCPCMSAELDLHRLVRARCALTVQAASKSGQNDGALTVLLQLDAARSAAGAPSDTAAAPRLVECDLSPAQLFTLLAVLEEANAKLATKQQE